MLCAVKYCVMVQYLCAANQKLALLAILSNIVLVHYSLEEVSRGGRLDALFYFSAHEFSYIVEKPNEGSVKKYIYHYVTS